MLLLLPLVLLLLLLLVLELKLVPLLVEVLLVLVLVLLAGGGLVVGIVRRVPTERRDLSERLRTRHKKKKRAPFKKSEFSPTFIFFCCRFLSDFYPISIRYLSAFGPVMFATIQRIHLGVKHKQVRNRGGEFIRPMNAVSDSAKRKKNTTFMGGE